MLRFYGDHAPTVNFWMQFLVVPEVTEEVEKCWQEVPKKSAAFSNSIWRKAILTRYLESTTRTRSFLNQSGEVKKGEEELRQELAPFAANKAIFDFNIKQVIQSGDIALMHTEWKVSSPQQMSVHAVEVARRQPDGTWRWLIGDPFTVGKQAVS